MVTANEYKLIVKWVKEQSFQNEKTVLKALKDIIRTGNRVTSDVKYHIQATFWGDVHTQERDVYTPIGVHILATDVKRDLTTLDFYRNEQGQMANRVCFPESFYL